MKMESTLVNGSGQKLKAIYYEGKNPNENLEGKIFQSVHAFCFYQDKLVLVFHTKRNYWMPPGGGIEPGESYEDAVAREVKEETNMKVLRQELIGFQDIYEPNRTIRQTRSFCIVEPYGEFENDPARDITAIKLIDPKDYKQYFDWGEIGERILQRSLELRVKM